MPRISEVDPATAHQWTNDGEAVLVDVREPHELAQAKLDDAVHVPISAFDPSLIPNEDDKKIVIVCAHGHRSLQVAQYLVAQGLLQEAFNLTGGVAAWYQVGLPLKITAA